MKKSVNEIINTLYGEDGVSCEPEMAEISEAVRNNDLEERSFQGDLGSLLYEWNQLNYIPEEKHRLIKKYHCQRIAYFVVRGWNDPIVLRPDGRTIKDGLHRFKAALFLRKTDVEVIIENLSS